VREQLLDVARDRSLETLADGVRNLAPRPVAERALQELERLRLGFAAIGLERGCTGARILPARRDGNDLFVEADCSTSVHGDPTEEHDARDRVRSLDEAGAGEVMVDESLRGESAEEPLDEAVLKVKLDDVVVNALGGSEDHRPYRRCPPPIEVALPVHRQRAERV
jgi:hypothetical protein